MVVPDDKLALYLLMLDHPKGGAKARFFRNAGFSPDDLPTMAAALIRHGENTTLQSAEEAGYGMKYVMVGPVHAPNGRHYTIRSVWLEEKPRSEVRLVTAYPIARGS